MEVLTILAILVSPVIAVTVSMQVQSRKEKRANQLQLLSTLIGLRHEGRVSADTVRALNLIEIVFHDEKEVRRLWKEYFDMVHNPAESALWNKKKLELITEMAKTLGYGKEISHLDMDRVYTPVALEEDAQRNNELMDQLLRVLKATKKLNIDADDHLLEPKPEHLSLLPKPDKDAKTD